MARENFYDETGIEKVELDPEQEKMVESLAHGMRSLLKQYSTGEISRQYAETTGAGLIKQIFTQELNKIEQNKKLN
ncbi:MAG: hypothetical protein WC663_02030 [Patescibacteria group bacterium]|jgi:hypothetical protein